MPCLVEGDIRAPRDVSGVVDPEGWRSPAPVGSCGRSSAARLAPVERDAVPAVNLCEAREGPAPEDNTVEGFLDAARCCRVASCLLARGVPCENSPAAGGTRLRHMGYRRGCGGGVARICVVGAEGQQIDHLTEGDSIRHRSGHGGDTPSCVVRLVRNKMCVRNCLEKDAQRRISKKQTKKQLCWPGG